MSKPIFSAISNNMGTIIVIRSPISRQWILNLSISNKGHFMRNLSVTLIGLISLVFYACITGPSTDSAEKAKPKYHYIHTSDTLWHDDMGEWNHGALDKTEYSVGIEWNTASIVMSDSLTAWTVGTVSYAKTYTSSPKPVFWNGNAIVIDWNKLPANWYYVVIKFSQKEEVVK